MAFFNMLLQKPDSNIGVGLIIKVDFLNVIKLRSCKNIQNKA